MFRKVFATFLIIPLLAACAAQEPGGKQKMGSLLGDGANKHVAVSGTGITTAGSLLGASLASAIGPSLDKVDMMYHGQTGQHALETARSGTTLAWNNPDSGHSGTITPQNVIERSPGEYCREYRQTVKAGDKSEEGYGTACRQDDGSWKRAE